MNVDQLQKKREYAKCWRDKNKESIRAYQLANKDKTKVATEKWNAAHKDVRAAHASKVRASKKLRVPAWLTKDQLDDIKSFYALAIKLEKLCGVKYHVDHIVPLHGKQVSGLHVPWNLQLLPACINFSKSNKHNEFTA